jgi:hypothetical protein
MHHAWLRACVFSGLQAAGGGLGGRSRLHLLLSVPEPHFDASEVSLARTFVLLFFFFKKNFYLFI